MPYVVIVEQAGAIPPTKYYERRAKLGLRVRNAGDALTTVVQRGEDGDMDLGMILQEGCLVTASKSKALAFAALAINEGYEAFMCEPRTVEPVDRYDEELVRIGERVNRVLGAKGRRPAAQEHVVTCGECLTTTQVSASYIITCPACGGLNVKFRLGEVIPMAKPGETDVFAFWEMTRFTQGWFELPVWDADGFEPNTATITDDGEAATALDCIANSPLLTLVQWGYNGEDLTMKQAAGLLDAAFCGRHYQTTETRREARLQMMIGPGQRAKVGIPLGEMQRAEIGDVGLGTDPGTQYGLIQLYKEMQDEV